MTARTARWATLPRATPAASDEGPLWPWAIYGGLLSAAAFAVIAGCVVLLRKLVGT